MILNTRGLVLAALGTALAPGAAAQITSYTQDFETLDQADGAALSNDGWSVFGNVFDGMGNFQYGYGPFGAPNGGPGFSAVASGSAGAPQGVQYLNAYNDYNNQDHAAGFLIESNVFQEQTIGAADVGETFTFSFDYLKNPTPINGDGGTTTQAFIKVLQQSNGSFALLAFPIVDTTNASTTTWTSDSISITIDPAWAGELIQFGFASTATNFEDSGRFYDNIDFSSPNSQPPSLGMYSQDFEALDIAAGDALSNDGWVVFANVFDAAGMFAYNYGTFPAPNGGAGFSGIATGDQGPGQGLQYLNIYNDYNNGDHANGFTINALVFQERTIGSIDAGKSVRFSFDFLKNPQVFNGAGATTTAAFLKVLDSQSGTFAELGAVSLDTTGASDTMWDSASLDLVIDPSWVGQLLQFGFESTATNFEDSGRFYDNITFGEASLGTNYCQSNVNSSGNMATISATGTDVAADNNFTLVAEGLPNNQFGIFIVSPTQANIPLGNGFLCVTGTIGRYSAPGQIQGTMMNGGFDLTIDLTAIPQGGGTVPTAAGQTWNFQAWFRDGVGTGSDLTNGLSVTFQ